MIVRDLVLAIIVLTICVRVATSTLRSCHVKKLCFVFLGIYMHMDVVIMAIMLFLYLEYLFMLFLRDFFFSLKMLTNLYPTNHIFILPLLFFSLLLTLIFISYLFSHVSLILLLKVIFRILPLTIFQLLSH